MPRGLDRNPHVIRTQGVRAATTVVDLSVRVRTCVMKVIGSRSDPSLVHQIGSSVKTNNVLNQDYVKYSTAHAGKQTGGRTGLGEKISLVVFCKTNLFRKFRPMAVDVVS